MEKKIFCPTCREDQKYEIRKEMETYPVKNESVSIDADVTYCSICGEQIWNQELDDENLKRAFRVYRDTHGLLQPEEIKLIREKYALTQVAFAQILGLGEKTIARYESGSLQDSAPNNLILLAGYPDAFKILLEKNREHISDICYEAAIERVSGFEVKTVSKGGKIAYSMSPSDNYDIQNSKNYYGGLFYVCAG